MKRLAATMLLIATSLLLHGILSLAQDAALAQTPAQDDAAAAPAQETAPAQQSKPAVSADDYTIFFSPPEKLDALFDAMMDAIPYANLEEFGAAHNNECLKTFMMYEPAATDLAALKALQPRFADMPEYWQMLWALSEEKTRDTYIEKAYGLFPQDPATVYFFVRRCALPALEKGDIPEKVAIENYRLSREYATLIANAAEMDGRNSFYWYEAAYTISRCGGLEETLAYIRRGNDCPVSEYVEPFPFSYIIRHRDEIAAKYPEKCLLLQPAIYDEHSPNWVEYRNMVKQIIVGVSMSGDLSWLTDAHRFTCRFAMQRNAPTLILLTGGSIEATLSSDAIKLGYQPEGENGLKGFALYQSNRGMIRGMCSAGTRVSRYENFTRNGLDRWDLTQLKLDDPRCKEYLRKNWDTESSGIHFLFPLVYDQLRRLYTFDFANPGAYIGSSMAMPIPETDTAAQ